MRSTLHERLTFVIIYQKFRHDLRIIKLPDDIAAGWCGLRNQGVSMVTIVFLGNRLKNVLYIIDQEPINIGRQLMAQMKDINPFYHLIAYLIIIT